MKVVATRRPPGRPPHDAHPLAREALLDAALALFAEQGVAATTSTQVAARAGVTPALVHYYFHPRERLLDAIVDERLSRFAARVVRALPASTASASATITALVDGVFDAAQEMPWMPPIWIREIAGGDGTLRARMLKRLPLPLLTALSERLAAAKRRGEIAAGIEPRFAFLSIAGATLFPLANQPLWPLLGGGAALTVAQLRAHAHAVLGQGLAGIHAVRRRTSR